MREGGRFAEREFVVDRLITKALLGADEGRPARFSALAGFVNVSVEFHARLVEACHGWLRHLHEVDFLPGEVTSHVHELPEWIGMLALPCYFETDYVPVDAAVRTAAAILGTSPRHVYAAGLTFIRPEHELARRRRGDIARGRHRTAAG